MFPFHLELFGKNFYYFEGIYYVISILLGYLLAFKIAKKQGVSTEMLQESILIAIISGFLGARLFQLAFYTEHITMKSILNGGLSITGGVILGPLFTYIICRVKKLPYWKLFTIVVPAVLFTQGLGRVGCFFNGDAHGVKTESVIGVTFPKYAVSVPSFELLKDEKRAGDAWKYSYENGFVKKTSPRSAKVHATQLYEAILDFGFTLVLVLLVSKVFKEGLNLRLAPIAYLTFYSFIRFFIEFFRADRVLDNGLPVSNMQIVLVLCCLSGLFLFFKFFKPEVKIKD